MYTTFITLENNKKYILLDEFEYKSHKYVILVNSLNKYDYALRKVFGDNLVGLENETALKEILTYYFQNILKETKWEI